jgi:hypothetical protein
MLERTSKSTQKCILSSEGSQGSMQTVKVEKCMHLPSLALTWNQCSSNSIIYISWMKLCMPMKLLAHCPFSHTPCMFEWQLAEGPVDNEIIVLPCLCLCIWSPKKIVKHLCVSRMPEINIFVFFEWNHHSKNIRLFCIRETVLFHAPAPTDTGLFHGCMGYIYIVKIKSRVGIAIHINTFYI